MRSIVKLAIAYLVAGAAIKAGEQIWMEGLSLKTSTLIGKLKNKLQKKES